MVEVVVAVVVVVVVVGVVVLLVVVVLLRVLMVVVVGGLLVMVVVSCLRLRHLPYRAHIGAWAVFGTEVMVRVSLAGSDIVVVVGVVEGTAVVPLVVVVVVLPAVARRLEK